MQTGNGIGSHPGDAMKIETVQLSRYTTLGVGGPAELWTVETNEDLRQAVQAPFRILGNGSNLLVADAGVAERVIKLGGEFRQWSLEGWVGAGSLVSQLLLHSQRAGLSGLEGLHGVPAEIGGAVRMNAGTRFGEMGQALAEVEIFHDGAFHLYQPQQLGLTYRHSQLPVDGIVTRVRLKLTPSTPAEVAARIALVDAARKGQPKKKSAGCAFRNPPLEAAGRLIDQQGLKGLRAGQAMISHEHGNFIVNLGGARAADIWQLIQRVQQELPLELEWEVWGSPASWEVSA